ncbi:hypothetical protein BV22DRAFT_597484 [Leucogyrophana mollusca]|uniref:Uncharacterized protein n=1 Tax=Leucogyrophana mollusca TaxID=85980 RepID=A0ACB8BCR9_9AGAM|nr:hypothetical protein BV22DRAFT_597484 [Leucogyrophana mollusca]
MLSQASDISRWANNPMFIEAIIFAMGPDKPTQVRHAALHTAWEIRQALRTPDNAILSMLSAFSAALSSAVLTNIHSEEDTTTPNSPDRFIYEERDVHYLQIISDLVQNSGGIWDRHLHNNGHFDRCLAIARHSAVGSLEARGAERSFVDAFDRDGLHISRAWEWLYEGIDDPEFLMALIACTRKYRDGGGILPYIHRKAVLRILKHLQTEQPRSPVIGLLNEVLVWLSTK